MDEDLVREFIKLRQKEFDAFVEERRKSPEVRKRVKMAKLEEPIRYTLEYKRMCRPAHWNIINYVLRATTKMPFNEATSLWSDAITFLQHDTLGDSEHDHRLLKDALAEVNDPGLKRLFEEAPPGTDEGTMKYGLQIVESIMGRDNVEEHWSEELYDVLTRG